MDILREVKKSDTEVAGANVYRGKLVGNEECRMRNEDFEKGKGRVHGNGRPVGSGDDWRAS